MTGAPTHTATLTLEHAAMPHTMQTAEPLDRVAANSGQEPVLQIAWQRGLLLDPPYQRGTVWGTRRRRNLIRSLLLGIPVGNVFLNERPGPDCTTAVVDGKQRIETVRLFTENQLSVPSSWFGAEDVVTCEHTDDGPYVRFDGLTRRGQGRFTRCSMTTQRTALRTVEEEADLFALINFGGLAQGETDLPE